MGSGTPKNRGTTGTENLRTVRRGSKTRPHAVGVLPPRRRPPFGLPLAPNSGHVEMTSSDVRARTITVTGRLWPPQLRLVCLNGTVPLALRRVPIRLVSTGLSRQKASADAARHPPIWLRPHRAAETQEPHKSAELQERSVRTVGSGKPEDRAPPLGSIPGCSLRASWARCLAHPARHLSHGSVATCG